MFDPANMAAAQASSNPADTAPPTAEAPPAEGAPAQDAPPPPDPIGPEVPRIEPVLIQELPGTGPFASAIVSPDGKSIYTSTVVPVVDVGQLINEFRRPLFEGALSIIAMVFLLWLRRASKRRGVKGSLYCRRCNYDLTSLMAQATPQRLCPECGANLLARRPTKGRRFLQRTATPFALFLLTVCTGVWFHVDGHQRFISPIAIRVWASRWLAEWGVAAGMDWPQDVLTSGDRISELDAVTGETCRDITQRAITSVFELTYNPLAQGVYVQDRRGIALVRVRDGRSIALLKDFRINQVGTSPVIGHSEDHQLTYVSGQLIPGPDNEASLIEWDWRAETRRVIKQVPPFQATHADPRHFAMIRADPIHFVNYPDWTEVYYTSEYSVSTVDTSGQEIRAARIPVKFDGDAPPAFSRDGSRMYLLSEYARWVVEIDVSTLRPVNAIPLESSGGGRKLTMRGDGRLLVVPRARSIALRDPEGGTWDAVLTHPDDIYGARCITFSDDGLTMAAVFQTSTPNGGYAFKLGVWKLPESLATRTIPAANR